MLQETRATAEWVETLADSYARAWGYDPAKLDTPLSYWHPTPSAAGGVAILLHPLSQLKTLKPLWEDIWDTHFMALTGLVEGTTITLACIYASTNKQQRERLFRTLRQRQPPGELLLVGGDFNCVLDEERDRSRTSRTNTDSAELRRLLHEWQLLDSISADLLQAQSHAEILELHANTHTYSYRLRDGTKASSRLDRWYVSATQYDKVASTRTVCPVSASDHDGVLLAVTPSGVLDGGRRVGRRAISYPIPVYAQEAVDAVSHKHVQLLAQLSETWTADEGAGRWDALKTDLRVGCLTAKRQAAAKLTNSLKQRIRRVTAALTNEKRRKLVMEGCDSDNAVATITNRMELLTLDGADREASLRRQLIILQQTMARRRQKRAIHKYDGLAPSATRAFFRRMAGRFSRPRVIGAGTADRAGSISAAQLALDWQPIVQQRPTTTADQDDFFARIQHIQSAPGSDEEIEDFTEAEVLAAIDACPAGKAGGPDGIPNDWYKAVKHALAPVLAREFSKWIRVGALPSSFTEATIFCLPKVSSPRNGLDFRPISLLNTDYKILSRLLLQRVSLQVESKVSQAQFGFVAQRQVHDAIDVWDAMQARVAQGELPATATAVMLDFAKAYDTLDRAFLAKALQFHAFSTQFIAVVDALHLATTARFLADGDMSGVVDIHNGIRQGCPLAPVLFILALDLLYKAAAVDMALSGLELAPGILVTLCGYADDTTAYLVHPREEAALLLLLDAFGAASGLRINVSKSRAVAIHPTGPTTAHADMVIPVMSASEPLRLLGMTVASSPNAGSIWARTLQQVRATLHLADLKTTNLLQRITLCQAVIMPKFLFVGRHAWPTSQTFDTLQRFIHRYAWHATLSDAATGSRAWMSAAVASLPARHGGLALPDVRAAFLKMSETTVRRWRSASTAIAAAAGEVLLRLCSGGPAGRSFGSSRLPAPPPRLAPTLAASGHMALRAARAIPRDAREQAALAPLLPATGRGRLTEKWWHEGWLHCQYDRRATLLAHLREEQKELYGDFSMAALLRAPAIGSDVLQCVHGVEAAASDFPGIVRNGDAIGDIIEVEWIQVRHVRFKCRTREWPLDPDTAQHFRRFCDTVVYNYPAVLLPHNNADELQPRPPTDATWRLSVTGDERVLIYEPVPGARMNLGTVQTMAQAHKLARAHDAALLRFEPHPLLDGYATIWTPRTPLRSRPAPPRSSEVAHKEVAGRERQSIEHDADIGAALATVSWSSIARLPASASRDRLLLHKIKGLRLSGWDRTQNRRGCPHCPTPVPGVDLGHTYHIMWYCGGAQALWRQLRAAWDCLGGFSTVW